jgi:magnesium chelatase subunit H
LSRRVLGSKPTDRDLESYLEAYFGDRLSKENRQKVILDHHDPSASNDPIEAFFSFLRNLFGMPVDVVEKTMEEKVTDEAYSIATLLDQSTEEIRSVIVGLDGGYIKPKPGGDLLRDGPSVLPTGRNIHALDPYRMPSATAWVRGQKAAEEIIRQHKESNNGKFPETVAVTLWGLDAIKTRGESVAIVLALVGATPVKEGTGRIVRYDLIPLDELGRPRVDVLASLSGIFR